MTHFYLRSIYYLDFYFTSSLACKISPLWFVRGGGGPQHLSAIDAVSQQLCDDYTGDFFSLSNLE